MELIPLMVGISVAIIVAIALFSVFPSLIASFDCPAIQGDDGAGAGDPNDFLISGSETSTDTEAVQQWKASCNNLQVQTTIVPVLLSLAIVISAIILVTRMFGA